MHIGHTEIQNARNAESQNRGHGYLRLHFVHLLDNVLQDSLRGSGSFSNHKSVCEELVPHALQIPLLPH